MSSFVNFRINDTENNKKSFTGFPTEKRSQLDQAKKINALKQMPDELLLAIFDYLGTPQEVASINRTCRRWNKLCAAINTPIKVFRLFKLYSTLPLLIQPNVKIETVSCYQEREAPSSEHPIFSYKVSLLLNPLTLKETWKVDKLENLSKSIQVLPKGFREKIICLFQEEITEKPLHEPCDSYFGYDEIFCSISARTTAITIISDPATLQFFDTSQATTFDQLAVISIKALINKRMQVELSKIIN